MVAWVLTKELESRGCPTYCTWGTTIDVPLSQPCAIMLLNINGCCCGFRIVILVVEGYGCG